MLLTVQWCKIRFGPVGALAADTVNVNLIRSQLRHQYLLTDGVLLLSADADVTNFQSNGQ